MNLCSVSQKISLLFSRFPTQLAGCFQRMQHLGQQIRGQNLTSSVCITRDSIEKECCFNIFVPPVMIFGGPQRNNSGIISVPISMLALSFFNIILFLFFCWFNNFRIIWLGAHRLTSNNLTHKLKAFLSPAGHQFSDQWQKAAFFIFVVSAILFHPFY